MSSMGERLKMARVKAGLSLRALAERVKVSPMAISKYERGLVVPGSAMLIKMANALSVKPNSQTTLVPRANRERQQAF